MLVSTAMDLSSLHIVKCGVATEGDIGVLQEIKCGATTEGDIRVSHTDTKMWCCHKEEPWCITGGKVWCCHRGAWG